MQGFNRVLFRYNWRGQKSFTVANMFAVLLLISAFVVPVVIGLTITTSRAFIAGQLPEFEGQNGWLLAAIPVVMGILWAGFAFVAIQTGNSDGAFMAQSMSGLNFVMDFSGTMAYYTLRDNGIFGVFRIFGTSASEMLQYAPAITLTGVGILITLNVFLFVAYVLSYADDIKKANIQPVPKVQMQADNRPQPNVTPQQRPQRPQRPNQEGGGSTDESMFRN